MDTTVSLFLFDKIKNKQEVEFSEIFNFLILIPLIGIIIEFIKENVSKMKFSFSDRLQFRKKNYIDLIASESTSHFYTETGIRAHYGPNILALSWYIKTNRIDAPIKYISNNEYVVGESQNIKIKDGLYLDIFNNLDSNSDKPQDMINITYRIHSNKMKVNEIQEFLENIKQEYIKITENNKLYHYIYEGEGKFSRTLISDLVDSPSLETFDHLFNEHSLFLKKDLERLKNISYYQRTGLKRKKGYLFYGEPGCGKTSSVMAMANYDNRHIIEVPLSRVQTNMEIEKILSLENLGEFNSIKKSEAIILFDELDCGLKIDKRIKKEDEKLDKSKVLSSQSTEQYQTSQNIDKLNLGSLLSRLDGIGNYDGLVIIATTNYKDNLDPALYRDLRLSPVYFDFCRKIDMINMIESFFSLKIKKEDLIKIPDRNAKISPAKLRSMLEKFEDNYTSFLVQLSILEK
jgi:hypothetical protein